ncbi:MAG: AMP-binding protein [Bacteroidota bacterium]
MNHDWSAKWAVYQPEHPAFKAADTGQLINYYDLNRLSNRLAHILATEYGVKKGDRIAVLSENCLEYVLLFVTAQKQGFILVPLNYRLASPELDYLLQVTEPQLLIWETQFAEKIRACKRFNTGSYHVTIEVLTDTCDPTRYEAEDQNGPMEVIEPDQPLFILFTSGTTGFPKGAIYTHRMLLWNSINTSMSLLCNPDSRTVNCMPPFHTGGWNVLTTPFLHHGGYTCIVRKFEPEKVLQLLASERATIFMGVPTMLKMMADLTLFDTIELPDLHYIIVGGEPMPVPLIERWHQKGIPIRQGYGMTEVGPNLTSLHQDDAIRKKGSIGRPNFYVETKIVDELGQEVLDDSPGELLLHGPMVTPGYWQQAEATAKSIKNGWFHTGDRVRRDEEGYLYVEDRIKNMFISGGENVYPAEVERVLLTCELVSEVVVVGVPDEKWGEVGHALIVLNAEKEFDEAALQDFCRDRLARFKVPKYFRAVAQLPKNDTGKIDRKALRKSLFAE